MLASYFKEYPMQFSTNNHVTLHWHDSSMCHMNIYEFLPQALFVNWIMGSDLVASRATFENVSTKYQGPNTEWPELPFPRFVRGVDAIFQHFLVARAGESCYQNPPRNYLEFTYPIPSRHLEASALTWETGVPCASTGAHFLGCGWGGTEFDWFIYSD